MSETYRLSANVPGTVGGWASQRSIAFDAVVLRPKDAMPHPLIVLNHGSPRDATERPTMTPLSMWGQAQILARRGFVVVAFLRQGYGQSQGDWAESYGPCNAPDYTSAGLNGARDIAAVAAAMQREPYVAKGPWISVGVSAGAFATVALSSLNPPGLVAAIAFAPGRGSSGPDQICGGPAKLVAAFAKYGETSRIPVLWVAAQNDHFFGPALVTQAVAAFKAGGGQVDLVQTGSYGEEGHFLFGSAGAPTWEPLVDTFLKQHGLAQRAEPIVWIRPSVSPPKGLSPRGIAAFETYLDSGPNKAFALGANGRYGWASGRRTPEVADADALKACAGEAQAACTLTHQNNGVAR